MPELPEVETTRRGIAPWVEGQTIRRVEVRQPALRWPIPANLAEQVHGQQVTAVARRGKYLLLSCGPGCLIIHLGMSGSLRILPAGTPPGHHDHVDLHLGSRQLLRYTDPRRFGAILWTTENPLLHPLLSHLGPEPLEDHFTGEYLYQVSRKRKQAIKTFIMRSDIVVGVGNIYANEALFAAGIHPSRQAGRISLQRCCQLQRAIRQVLTEAITAGGTTLRDFTDSQGKPGYFRLALKVYGREHGACIECNHAIRRIQLGQRGTWYCARCQR